MALRQKPRKLHTRSSVTVPFPVADGALVAKAATVAGEPTSRFIRLAALARAETVLRQAGQPTAKSA